MSRISNAHSSFTPTCWACRRSVLMSLKPGRWVFLRCESTVTPLSTCSRLEAVRMRLSRGTSVREISIISAWWWTDRTFRGLLIISQTTELVFVKARFHDGARVAERPRFIFSTPTGMKSRSVAIKPVSCALNSRPRLHVFAFLKLDLYDPPSFHIDNGKPVAIVLNSFSGAGAALQRCQNKTRQGVIIR